LKRELISKVTKKNVFALTRRADRGKKRKAKWDRVCRKKVRIRSEDENNKTRRSGAYAKSHGGACVLSHTSSPAKFTGNRKKNIPPHSESL
jgi:hypothetical protein